MKTTMKQKVQNAAIAGAIVLASFGAAKAQTPESTPVFRRSPVSLNLSLADSAKRFTKYKTEAEASTLTSTNAAGTPRKFAIYGAGQEILIPVGKQSNFILAARGSTVIENNANPATGIASAQGAPGTPQTVHSEGQFDLGFSTPNLKIVASGFGANEPTNAYKMNGGIGGLISGQTDAGSAGASVRTIISKTGNGTPLDKKTDGSFFVNVSVPALVPVLAEAVPDLKLSVGTRSDYFSSEYNLFGQINNLSSTFATTFSASYPVFGRLLSANASLNPNLTRIEVNYETGASLELFGGYTHAVGLDASGAQVTTNIVGGGIRFVY